MFKKPPQIATKSEKRLNGKEVKTLKDQIQKSLSPFQSADREGSLSDDIDFLMPNKIFRQNYFFKKSI